MALPTINLSLIPVFPAKVIGDGPVVIIKDGLNYTISWDMTKYSVNPAPDVDQINFLGYNDETEATERYTSSALREAMGYGVDTIRAPYFPPANDTVNLSAIRRRLRNMPDLGDYGITSSGVTEYGQSDFDVLATGLVGDGLREVLSTPGNYRLGETIQTGLGLRFLGESKSTTVFKMYHYGTGFVFTGAQEVGGAISNLSIVNDSGAQCVAYIQIIASLTGTSPDFFAIQDCNLTGFSGATSQYGIIFDGNARDGTAPNLLKGVRDLVILNTQVFNCDVMNTELRQARGVYIGGLEHYQAGGAVAKMNISGATSLKPSASVRLVGSILGDLSIQYAGKVIGTDNDIAGCTVAADATNCVIGVASGAVTNNSTTSVVIGNS